MFNEETAGEAEQTMNGKRTIIGSSLDGGPPTHPYTSRVEGQ